MNGRPWTKAEDKLLRAQFPHEPTSILACALGRSYSATSQRARLLGIRKSAAYMASEAAGRANLLKGPRFPKGNVPWNAGLKGWYPKGSEKNWFGKGNRPQTWVPVGTEIIDPEGYRWRKVSEHRDRFKRWRMVHVLVWEKHRGKIPRGKFLVFKNRDKTDIRIRNLMLTDRAGLMRLNTLQRYPKPIVRAAMQIGWLNRVIRERTEHANR